MAKYTITVKSSELENPVPNTLVALRDTLGNWIKSSYTDKMGKVNFETNFLQDQRINNVYIESPKGFHPDKKSKSITTGENKTFYLTYIEGDDSEIPDFPERRDPFNKWFQKNTDMIIIAVVIIAIGLFLIWRYV